eukprot:NODE_2339_length_953_cov_268.695991.p1 GENE.NODE_2339_length_953_cov_268.695991~~NODE_2339_length_953_cov_268.695991.p1  ORF type:complete len:285 (-),score=84.21 NODE_2339_length_953_cov_268.695991:97-897(-)
MAGEGGAAVLEPRAVQAGGHVAETGGAEGVRLRRGVDCMARRFSLFDWGMVTPDELAVLIAQLETEVRWQTKSFGGCPRDIASWIFADFDREAPPPEDMACVGAHMAKLLGVLDQVHAGDVVFPIQLYVNRYNDGRNYTRVHAHYCRQLTVSLGNERALDVEGPGIPGRQRLRLRTGDVVLLDGQLHGVVEDSAAVGLRFSLNLFYCTAEDLTTQRRGRSAVSVQYAPHVARQKTPCFRCGFHHPRAERCEHEALGPDWNAGHGIA